MIKQLTHEDLPYCLSVILQKKKISGTVPLKTEAHEVYLTKFFSDDKKYKVLGYFEDGALVSWLALGFYETETLGKFWLVLNMFSTKQRTYFNFTNPEISDLFKASFELAESMGVYQYFYCVSEKIAKVYETQWAKKNPMNYHGVYELKDLAVVLANTVPDNPLYWGLMGYETRPHDMYIKARIKKR